MSNKIKDKISEVQNLHAAASESAENGDFASKLAAQSFSDHLEELSLLEIAAKFDDSVEVLDFRLIANHLKSGSAPLDLVAGVADSVRKLIGYAALRLTEGGMGRKRIPKSLFQELDLRLAGLLPGSSRFIVSTTSGRDLLDDGVSKRAIERVFSVLSSGGEGQEFLDSVNELGQSGTKNLRELLYLIKSHHAEADISWCYDGKVINVWNGDKSTVESISTALDLTEIVEEQVIRLSGKVELLSQREKIELRSNDGSLYKILYPRSLLAAISKLHLQEEVSLECKVTETDNPMTGESSIFYELIDIS